MFITDNNYVLTRFTYSTTAELKLSCNNTGEGPSRRSEIETYPHILDHSAINYIDTLFARKGNQETKPKQNRLQSSTM